MATKTWNVRPWYPAHLDGALRHFPRLIRQVAWNRGLGSKDDLERFMNPSFTNDVSSPMLFRDMQRVLTRIERALQNDETITIFADYDADGVCGAAILAKTFEKLGLRFDTYFPHRQDEGYGLNREAIGKIAARGTKVLITVDCGISNRDEITYANEQGLDVIITDHHEQLMETPPAYAILHPKKEGETYPDKNLCGGGVAFKLAQAIIGAYPKVFLEGFDKWLLDLAAISTVADYGKLTGENRSLVKYGLIVIAKSRNAGLLELLFTSGLSKKETIDTYDVAMKLVPLLNAAGRMNHANAAYRLLTSKTREDSVGLADGLKKENTLRQQKTEEIYEEALAQVAGNTGTLLVCKNENWPITLAGIVATRLVNEFGKPVAVLGKKKGLWAGSVRSIPSFHVARSLQDLSSYLLSYGGHPMAAGFTLKEASSVDVFIEAWQELARKHMGKEEYSPVLDIECSATLDDLTPDLLDWLEKLKPFGEGNPKPRFLLERVVLEQCSPMGKNGNHLRLLVAKPSGDGHVKFVFFNGLSTWGEALQEGTVFDAVVELDYNVWRGYTEVQVKIIDLKVHSKVNVQNARV